MSFVKRSLVIMLIVALMLVNLSYYRYQLKHEEQMQSAINRIAELDKDLNEYQDLYGPLERERPDDRSFENRGKLPLTTKPISIGPI
jgi:hypothetical protein